MSDPASPHSAIHAKSVFTIPAGAPFAAELAQGIIRLAKSPEDLARAIVMVPSRRAARALHAAFLESENGAAMLLPRMVPIGDIDEDDPDILVAPELGATLPPPVNELRRNLILAQLLEGFQLGGHRPSPAQAMALATSLGQLLDQIYNAGAKPEQLRDLLPEQFALHWQDILKLFAILIDRWPDILANEGVMDLADRRSRLTNARTAIWRENSPDQLIVVAGSTGTFAATKDLIDCVAHLPRGHVVLPGLDQQADDEWSAIKDDAGHPQHQLSQLLDYLEMTPDDVAPWNPELVLAPETMRRQMLMREVFKPALLTTQWRELSANKPELNRDALVGLEIIECPDKRSEAGIIALSMREVLETTGRTAALITPDRALAAGVIAELQRWDITIDDSAGQPLSSKPAGMFLQLLANAAAQDFAPVPLLALLKHPLTASGMEASAFRQMIGVLERSVLRGYRPQSGLNGIADYIAEKAKKADHHRRAPAYDSDQLIAFVNAHLIAPLADLIAVWNSPAPTYARLSMALALAGERLAARQMNEVGGHDAGDGALHLWQHADGEAASQLMKDLAEYGHDTAVDPDEFPQILAQLLAAKTVRGRWPLHQRLSVLGPVEARMQSADRLIIAGFNEGHWPPQQDSDPWMNGTMRDAVGLPARNWRSGLSAHDIYMASCGKDVIITRSLRENDAPTTPSRWLQRLTTVMKALQVESALDRGDKRLAWRQMLEPDHAHKPVGRPVPKPPINVRPRQFSATEIDRWIDDPYAIYARRILNLRRLDELDPPPDAALRGTLVHDALAAFIADFPAGPLPANALEELIAQGRKIFAPQWHMPSVEFFWWPRFEAVASWFIEEEQRRREIVKRSLVEIKGAVSVAGPAGDVVFSARADRLDFGDDNDITVIDYKTGGVPTAKQVANGRRTQLLIESLIAAEGGFKDAPAGDIGAMQYWQLTGKQGAVSKINDVRPEEWEPSDTRGALEKLVAQFDDPDTGYPSQPDRKYKPKFSDYEHLARVKEWSVEGGGDE